MPGTGGTKPALPISSWSGCGTLSSSILGTLRAGLSAEATKLDTFDFAGWPKGMRAVCRREDPIWRQLAFSDPDEHRFQV
jgi:hypothetical protein